MPNPDDLKRLAELKDQRDKLNAKVLLLEQKVDQQHKTETLERDYVKVVCLVCRGTEEGGFGPEDVEDCRACDGQGWLYARRWDGHGPKGHPMEHDTTFDQREG